MKNNLKERLKEIFQEESDVEHYVSKLVFNPKIELFATQTVRRMLNTLVKEGFIQSKYIDKKTKVYWL